MNRVGRVYWFNVGQGYGYISLEDGSLVYFHQTALRTAAEVGACKEGAQVSFDILETHTGLEAQNVEAVPR